ncbi:phage major capsid protein [Sinorhizobium meliloti]|nr:phage major capsid protein [Sinorhizobium meliloti]
MTVERLEFKAAFTADDTGAIEGKAWDFSSPDRVGDVIESKAFAGAIGKTLPMLFAHDQAQAIGVWDSVTVEPDGLKVRGKMLVDDVARAKEVRALIKAQAVTGLSVGFMTKKAAPRKGGGRTISELDLVECSIVAVPAHPGAQISNVKDLPLTNAIETKTVEDLAVELKAANDNIALVTKRLEDAETKLARPAILKAANDNEPTPERKAFTSYLRRGKEALGAEEVKSLRVADDTAGGYLAPSEFSAEVIKGIVEMSPIRQAARVGSTSSGEVILPKRTGRPTGSWVGETEARPATESAYGQVEVPIHEMACYVDVSQRLLEDAAVSVESEVASDLSEEFGRLEALGFSQGDGVKKPVGIMEAAGVAYTPTGNASTLGSAPADTLIDAFYALPAYYRNRGVWMMNSKTIASVRKLKDGSTGAYLWQPGLAAGDPATILGRPLIEDPTMDDVGSAAEPILFGDIASAYRIYDRIALSIMRDPYSQAANGLVRFHARRRTGGALVLAEAIRKIKCATA